MPIAFDPSALPGYTALLSRHNADGSASNARSFRDAFLEQVRSPSPDNAETVALQDEITAKYDEFKKMTGCDESMTWYGDITMEELLLEYDFVPASQGVPAGPDPFTAYYDIVGGGSEGYVNAYLPTTIPVFKGTMTGTNHPDGRTELSGDVAGYFVKKGSLGATSSSATFSLTKIAVQGNGGTGNMLDALLKELMSSVGGDMENAGGGGEGKEAAALLEELRRLRGEE